MKGTVAELVINEIASLDPPGRFLEPQADQRFREVSRKRAIEKTCQALREKKNNNGRLQQDSSNEQDKANDGHQKGITSNEADKPAALVMDQQLPNDESAVDSSKPTSHEKNDKQEAVTTIM